MVDLDNLNYENGLVMAVAQDYETNEVLMCAYMDKTALEKTVETGYVHYWSRSRNKLWKKGESSGHLQLLHEMYVDCDMDAVLLKIKQIGASCHEGFYSCFYRTIEGNIVGKKVFEPEDVY
ncbi:phosphoribosyl-AMP cyclohydrolase [Methanohalobium sp.]|uniref:phosphoribosyl-AMP cyclohydrolase n=1 Tax=Methanohalobium sp. TaxID=2837493 RepID=UPI0025E58810|nr:phosphoribosyl-AMP cyclohydrolase [Methanohalobium sp.]